jgi:hypothetical protein
VANVKKVKNHKPGFVVNPNVLMSTNTIMDLDRIHHSKGYCSALITDTGAMGGKLVGAAPRPAPLPRAASCRPRPSAHAVTAAAAALLPPSPAASPRSARASVR